MNGSLVSLCLLHFLEAILIEGRRVIAEHFDAGDGRFEAVAGIVDNIVGCNHLLKDCSPWFYHKGIEDMIAGQQDDLLIQSAVDDKLDLWGFGWRIHYGIWLIRRGIYSQELYAVVFVETVEVVWLLVYSCLIVREKWGHFGTAALTFCI